MRFLGVNLRIFQPVPDCQVDKFHKIKKVLDELPMAISRGEYFNLGGFPSQEALSPSDLYPIISPEKSLLREPQNSPHVQVRLPLELPLEQKNNPSLGGAKWLKLLLVDRQGIEPLHLNHWESLHYIP